MLRLLEERKNAGMEEADETPEKGSRRKCRGWHPRRMARRPGMNLRAKLVALTMRVALLTTCAVRFVQSRSKPAVVQGDTRIVADFRSRIAKYIDLRKKAGDSPKRSKQDMEVGVDTERAFMIVEIAGDDSYVQTSRVPGRQLIRGR